jgi:hypothetical protein
MSTTASERLIVELKTVDRLAPIHLAQALSYLKATQLPLALVVRFHVPVLLRVVLCAPHLSDPGVPGALAVLSPSRARPAPGTNARTCGNGYPVQLFVGPAGSFR